ncbi:MAG: ABC transporter permease [Spirochaetales bacterium]|nr:ABC transporter permease [Spirochaetales bacterium]
MAVFGVIFKEAVSSILAHKSRAALTLLGVVIGIASVVTVIAAGNGGRAIIMKEFEGFSPRTLQITPNYTDMRVNTRFRPVPMDDRDLEDIERGVGEIEDVAPVLRSNTTVRVGTVEKTLLVTGTTNAFINFVEFELESGRVISDAEVASRAKVAIVGAKIVEEFFPEGDAIGEYLTAFDTPILIVGTLRRKEKAESISLSDPDKEFNNAVVVTVGVFKRVFGNRNQYNLILANVKDLGLVTRAKERIVAILTRNHGMWGDEYYKFRVTSMSEQIALIDSVIGAVTLGVALLAGIALLVAAIGIMNIMLVSVKERTREIGIRKALGAKRSLILLQFLIETVLLTGGGGLVGLGLAFAASAAVAALARWPSVIEPATCVVAVAMSLLTGLLSGLYPASRAARLPPQEALRYE